jgi:acyl-CoA synthetase (AMP-forming)/AMP-acid ligase II
VSTIADLLLARAADDHVGLLAGDQQWRWDQIVQAGADRAALFRTLRDADRPPHIGVLLENVPEFVWWLGAAALSGGVVVGINPTRRGTELARDIRHADCQLIITSHSQAALLDGLDTGVRRGRVLVVGQAPYADLLASHLGSPLADPGAAGVSEQSLYLLIFTSGTTGAPKACLCSQGRLAGIGELAGKMMGLGPREVHYLAMPLFHSNALMAGWAPALATGTPSVLRDRFSASGFLPDVRRYGVTYVNYVGKPLSYILATPEQPDDAENTLRLVFGNEAAELDVERFAKRFDCVVMDAYGSTEGGVSVVRSPDTPPGSLGVGLGDVAVLNPATGAECPAAEFDQHGRLLNPEEAIGELVNRLGGTGFEGYWNNDEANVSRVHDGIYWTGDLAYRDEAGFLYFAGRDHDWLRVDGENFASAPVERILARYPGVLLAVVFAVPDAIVGDQVMAVMQLKPGAAFDPSAFAAFLAGQEDLGTKWAPRFVRVTDQLPLTETGKVVKRSLRAERWECDDPVWWRPDARGTEWRRLTDDDIAAIAAEFGRRGRSRALELP